MVSAPSSLSSVALQVAATQAGPVRVAATPGPHHVDLGACHSGWRWYCLKLGQWAQPERAAAGA